MDFADSAAAPLAPRFHLRAAVPQSVRALIDKGELTPHFQPIAELSDGVIYAHEALIRPDAGCRYPTPDELFAAARRQGVLLELELECARLALLAWGAQGHASKLFLNLSAEALMAAVEPRGLDSLMEVTQSAGLSPSTIVVELTEHERVRDVGRLVSVVGWLRRHGVAVALDDFGDGRSSLRLWSELKPEFVKIDKYFVQGLPSHPEKVQTLRALIQISQTLGASLVAEGIERADELHVLRDLGIRLGQGWLLGRPQALAASGVLEPAADVIRSKDLAIFPERRRSTEQRASVQNLVDEVPAIAPTMTNDDLMQHFSRDEALRAVAIAVDGKPVGLVSRRQFADRYVKPYWRELYGRQPCTLFANLTPRIVDVASSIDDLTAVLTSEDQRYLQEGFIVVRDGRYAGIGSSERLVRTVTEARIEAARHANPLTLLPGNIPITQHLDRLLNAGREFVACYADLNQFKPFNDLYGYWRGDEMLMLLARCLVSCCDARRDFVGHVGGDDFIVVFQSDDWEARCAGAVASFDAQAAQMYDEQAQRVGGIEAEDRHGVVRFHPLSTLAVGVVRVRAGTRQRPEDIASAAARAKRLAKHGNRGIYVMDVEAA